MSRGKHRSPREGACFTELASYLVGERWSDHPACTHPLLAAVARDVNDYTSGAGRGRLAELIPSVIGLTGDDLHLDARIALGCARTALPVVAAERQRVMAVAILGCERVLTARDGWSSSRLEEQSQQALAQVPHAAQWARDFTRGIATSAKAFRRCAPSMVHAAVEGVALACVRSQMRSSVHCSPARSAVRRMGRPGRRTRHREARGLLPHAHRQRRRPLTRRTACSPR